MEQKLDSYYTHYCHNCLAVFINLQSRWHISKYMVFVLRAKQNIPGHSIPRPNIPGQSTLGHSKSIGA